MKRIVFLLKKEPNFIEKIRFFVRMAVHGIAVRYIDAGDEKPVRDALFVTDSKEGFYTLSKEGIEPLVLIDKEEEMDSLPEGRFFVMDVFNAETDYFEKIYRRTKNIPWEVIKTKRLLLRETVEADVDVFYEMYKDPRMTLYMEDLYKDPDEERKYVTEYREHVYFVQGFGVWTVIRRKDKKIIGRAGLTMREGFDDIEIGFAIGTKYWGKGYAKEAISSILDYAKELGFEHVIALVMPGNKVSEHILTKFGFLMMEEVVISGTKYNAYRL